MSKENKTIIQLIRLRAQQDDLGDNGAIRHFKRVLADGVARHDESRQTGFRAILDMRARLFSVGPRQKDATTDGIPMHNIGKGLVHEMSLFTVRPVEYLVSPAHAAATEHRSEWIVTDPDHFAGLLHRISEQKAFGLRSEPFDPPRLREMRRALWDDVVQNVYNVRSAFTATDDGLATDDVFAPHFGAWKAFKDEYLADCHDHHERASVAHFFERVAQFDKLWNLAIQGRGRRDYSAPVASHVKDFHDAAMRNLRSLRGDIFTLLARLEKTNLTKR